MCFCFTFNLSSSCCFYYTVFSGLYERVITFSHKSVTVSVHQILKVAAATLQICTSGTGICYQDKTHKTVVFRCLCSVRAGIPPSASQSFAFSLPDTHLLLPEGFGSCCSVSSVFFPGINFSALSKRALSATLRNTFP